MTQSSSRDILPETITPKDPKPRALADIQLNTLLAADQGTSSEDEGVDVQTIPADAARTAIGVSISHEQTRLTSPATPAVEKAAAIEQGDGFFGRLGATNICSEEPNEDDEQGVAVSAGAEELSDSKAAVLPTRSPRKTVVRMPSPWRSAEPKRSVISRSFLRDGLFNRRRASSGPEMKVETLHKSLIASLPSMPKRFSLTSPFSSSFSGPVEHAPMDQLHRQHSPSDSKPLSPRESEPAQASVGNLPQRPQLQIVQSRHPQLRRSTSDNSLTTYRTLSTVSSLGDDTRWADVHEQVNSRLQAIRDSWQDSNIRLPSFPSLSNLKVDFLRDRSGSFGRKQNEVTENPTDPTRRQPYHSAKAAVTDVGAVKTLHHPHLHKAIQQLNGDVVILGGYRGSILRSAEPPHRQVWVPLKVGLNIRKVDLEVGLEEDADMHASEKIIPGGMLTHIGPIDIARRLFKRLRSCENAKQGRLRVHDYGYDWRLDPTLLSNQLISFLEKLPCNKAGMPAAERGAIVIAHSLGGLITRHAVNKRPELFKGVVYAGVPNTCVNILGPLRNGDEVLLSSRVLTAQVNFTIRTSFALLPLDGRCFFDSQTKEEYPVDFFDPQTWVDYRLSPCVAKPLPPLAALSRPSGLTGYVNSVASALPNLSLPGRKSNVARSKYPNEFSNATGVGAAAEPDTDAAKQGDNSQARGNGDVDDRDQGVDSSVDTTPSPRLTVTISHKEAVAYLTRVLPAVKKFKQQLAFNPQHAASNLYPPISVIYGKSTPTVYGARVNGREGIKHADAYDDLAFASGDGVALARAAMAPEGYMPARGGTVSSERGHVALLGDLEAVGKCLIAIVGARRSGVGCGIAS